MARGIKLYGAVSYFMTVAQLRSNPFKIAAHYKHKHTRTAASATEPVHFVEESLFIVEVVPLLACFISWI